MTQKELCEWLQIFKATAYNYRQQGTPYVGKGKGIRYNPDKVQEWLNNRSKKF